MPTPNSTQHADSATLHLCVASAGDRLALHLRTSRLAKLLESKVRTKEDAAGSKRDSLKRRRSGGTAAVTEDDETDTTAPAAMADDPDAHDEDERALAILSIHAPRVAHVIETLGAPGSTTTAAIATVRDTHFTPEDADMPLLFSLRVVCDAARAARGEAPLPPSRPLPPLPVDGFSRRALNRTAGQKSVFVADFDEDNDGEWADVAAQAAAAAVAPSGANDGEAGDDGADGDTANLAARSRIRLLTISAGAAAGAAEPPSTAALAAPAAAPSGGAPRATHDAALCNITLAVCASFGWTYPHGPGHPKYDAAVALVGVDHGSAGIDSVETAMEPAAAAAAVPHEPVDGGDDDDELLVAAAERFFGEGGFAKLDESVGFSGIAATEVASDSVVGEPIDASAVSGAMACDAVPGLAPAAPVADPMGGGVVESASISNPAPPQAQKRAPSRVVRFGRGGQRYFAPAPSAVSVALTRNVGAAHLHVGVEELSLHHYAERGQGGGWAGSHCEGSIVTSVAALLLWPVIFSASVPDTLITPYQVCREGCHSAGCASP